MGVSLIGWTGLTRTLIAEFSGAELSGIATGYNTSIILLGSILGPLVFGYIVDVAHSYRPAWMLLIFLLMAGIALMVTVREERRVV